MSQSSKGVPHASGDSIIKADKSSLEPQAASRFRARKKPLVDPDTLEEITEAFRLFDSEATGTLGPHELKAALRALGYKAKKADIRQILKDVDKEDVKQVDFDDFVQILASRMAPRNSKEEIEKIFKLFDEENTGKITFKVLKKVISEVGEDIADDEIQEMIAQADRNGDGVVDQDEFFRVMKRRGNNGPFDDLSSDEDDA